MNPNFFSGSLPFLFKYKWIQIVFLAFIYYVAGRIGQQLAIPPGYITAIWPPSGIALAAVLIFGYPVLPGVFLGSFFNNFFLFDTSLDPFYVVKAILASAGIGFGASLQAYIGAYFIQKYIPLRLLDTLEGILKFFIISIVSCLVNANIGLFSLSFVQHVDWMQTWWTWWIGDSTGVLIFTPLIVSWIYYPFYKPTLTKTIEAFVVFLLILIFTNAIFSNPLDLTYVLVPLVIWIGFSFYQKGVTLAIALIAGLVIWNTSNGYGPFFNPNSLNLSLLSLDLFFVILTFTALLIVAGLTERQHAKKLLEIANLNLEHKVKERTHELELQLKQVRRMQKHVLNKEKLASLGTLVAGVAHEIKNPLNFIINFSEISLELLKQIESHLNDQKNKLSKTAYNDVTEALRFIETNTFKVIDHSKKINYTIEDILQHVRNRPKKQEETNLNEIILEYIKLVYHSRRQKNANLSVHIQTKLDPSLPPLLTNKPNICRVILNLLDNAFDSMEEKQTLLGAIYQPEIIASSKDHPDYIEISIFDNGIGIPLNIQDKIFLPFFTQKSTDKGTGLGLYISYEIIVKEHFGSLEFLSKEDEYTIFTIKLPKIHP